MTNPKLMIQIAAKNLKPNTSCFVECDLAMFLVSRSLYNEIDLFPYNNVAERILQEMSNEDHI